MLTVKVPDAGSVRFRGTKRVKGARTRVGSAGRVRMPIRARDKGQVRRQLDALGFTELVAKVTYIPNTSDPNIVGKTFTKWVRLVRRG